MDERDRAGFIELICICAIASQYWLGNSNFIVETILMVFSMVGVGYLGFKLQELINYHDKQNTS